jgi:hypothetical protein
LEEAIAAERSDAFIIVGGPPAREAVEKLERITRFWKGKPHRLENATQTEEPL